MQLISDSELIKIQVKDCNEHLVKIKDFCPNIILRPATYIKKEGEHCGKQASLVREGVARRLAIAQSNLPKGHRIALRCGYRPLAIQRKRYEWMFQKLKKRHPSWSEHLLKKETSKLVAPLDIIPPHATGGAVDVTIQGPDRRLLQMGTRMGEFNSRTRTDAPNISPEAKKHRRMLYRAMEEAGFVNYPTEWWHWSYGDQYWAAAKKKCYALYKGR